MASPVDDQPAARLRRRAGSAARAENHRSQARGTSSRSCQTLSLSVGPATNPTGDNRKFDVSDKSKKPRNSSKHPAAQNALIASNGCTKDPTTAAATNTPARLSSLESGASTRFCVATMRKRSRRPPAPLAKPLGRSRSLLLRATPPQKSERTRWWPSNDKSRRHTRP